MILNDKGSLSCADAMNIEENESLKEGVYNGGLKGAENFVATVDETAPAHGLAFNNVGQIMW